MAADRWIVERRPGKRPVDPRSPVGVFLEEERTELGHVAPVVTVLLANRECPWKCLMCDLWRDTTDAPAPPGTVLRQIELALSRYPDARRVKLYNHGSFFDPGAVPPEDLAPIAARLEDFERVIVESHPALVGETCRSFANALSGRLEVAMGLETIHPDVLPRLNKKMTVGDFEAAAARLASWGAALRAFVLVGLPWISRVEAVAWAVRSAGRAFDFGATAVSLIAIRSGNGALDALARRGELEPPELGDLEDAVDGSLRLIPPRGRVFADLWDLERLERCHDCFDARRQRLAALNRSQRMSPRVICASCSPP